MNSGITTWFELANKLKPYLLVVVYKDMCEHVRELADESIRTQTEFPSVVGEHLESCGDCSQYIALCSVVSIAGRPPIQMPPVELSNRIASSTFAKPFVWSGMFRKPAMWAPALGVMAAAGWLLATPRDAKEPVKHENIAMSRSAGGIVISQKPAKQIVPSSTQSFRSSVTVSNGTPSGTPSVARTKVRQEVKRITDSRIRELVVATGGSVAIPENTRSATSGVSGVDIAAANPIGPRVPNITTDMDPVVDVQMPKSVRNATGRASLVLASVDDEVERDDLRASFQSQLNQQSESFRTTISNAPMHGVDTNRINVVNAPVVTGGK